MANIKNITGRQIFDSRGNPTIEVDVILENNIIGKQYHLVHQLVLMRLTNLGMSLMIILVVG